MRDFTMVRDFYLYGCKNPHMMENTMSRPPGVVMSTTEKPMQHPPVTARAEPEVMVDRLVIEP